MSIESGITLPKNIADEGFLSSLKGEKRYVRFTDVEAALESVSDIIFHEFSSGITGIRNELPVASAKILRGVAMNVAGDPHIPGGFGSFVGDEEIEIVPKDPNRKFGTDVGILPGEVVPLLKAFGIESYFKGNFLPLEFHPRDIQFPEADCICVGNVLENTSEQAVDGDVLEIEKVFDDSLFNRTNYYLREEDKWVPVYPSPRNKPDGRSRLKSTSDYEHLDSALFNRVRTWTDEIIRVIREPLIRHAFKYGKD